MTVAKRFERLAGAAARRPVLTVGIVLALALGGALLSLSLKPSAGIDTFVSKSSSSYRATADDERHFGDDAVIVLIREPLPDLVETKDLGTVTQLEACFAGQVVVANQTLRAFTPAAAGAHTAYGGPQQPVRQAGPDQAGAGRLRPGHVPEPRRGGGQLGDQRDAGRASDSSVKAVERSAYQLALGRGMTRAKALVEAKAAGALEYQQQMQSLEQLALDSGDHSLPSIDSPQFIPSDRVRPDAWGQPAQGPLRLSVPDHQLGADPDPPEVVAVRRPAGPGDLEIRQAIKMPMFRSAYGGRYTVTGVPVVVNDLASTIPGSIAGLLVAVLVVMAIDAAGGVPQSSPAAAARHRAGRRGHHLRAAGASSAPT